MDFIALDGNFLYCGNPVMGGHMYSGLKIRLQQAELRMSGKDGELLVHKREENARKIVWC